jgi:translation initiation factor IF-3
MADISRVRHCRVQDRFPVTIDEAGDHIAAHEVRINDRIRAREVFLVGAEGEQLGVRPLPEALAQSREQELDLVEVAPNANPPVCRIMDYGRYVYEQEQRRRQSKRKATNVVIKEMKFRPKIDEHDYTTKMKHVVRFLGEGNKVKLTIMFRGREMAHPELGMKILRRVADDVADFAVIESDPRQDGRNMTMVLHPVRKDGRKASSKAEAVEARQAENQQPATPPAATPQAATPQPVPQQAATVPEAPAAPDNGAQ